MINNSTKMADYKLKIIYFILAIFSTLGTSYYFLLSTGNIFNIVFLFIFYYMYQKLGFKAAKRQNVYALTLSGIYSFLLTIGKISRSDENITDSLNRYIDSVTKDEFTQQINLNGWDSIPNTIIIFIMFAGITIVLYFLIIQLIKLIEFKKKNAAILYPNLDSTKIFIISFFVILILWMPYFIINYPGVLTYDAINQISQIMGDNPYSNHHPLVHTFLLQIFFNWGRNRFYSENLGIALYVIMQMCVLSAIYSYLIKVLYKNGLKLKFCILILLYFALVPINPMYAINTMKNSLYSGFILLLSVYLYQIFICKDKSILKKFLFPISILCVTLFRTNGLIAYILCVPFIIVFSKNFDRNFKIKLRIISIIPVILSIFLTSVVYNKCGFEKNNIVEGLCMPIQHIARVVVDCEDDLTDNEIQEIQKFMASDLDSIKSRYNCRFADPMKQLLWSTQKEEVISKNKLEFAKLYLTLGIKHPLTYIKSEVDSTVGYFNSDMQYIYTNIYGVYPNDYNIYLVQNSKGPVYTGMKKWCELFRYIPLLGNLFNPATMLLIILFIITVYLYTKKYIYIIIALPALTDLFTIFISAPIHGQVCYVYSLMVTFPLILLSFYMWIVKKDIS